MTRRNTGKRTPEMIDKMMLALNMRKGGMEYHAIAKELGYANESGVRYLVTQAMRMTIQEPAEEVKQMEIARYNDMLVIAAAIAHDKKSSPDQKLRALDRMLAVAERRSRLQGLDAPIRREVTVFTEDAFTAALKEVEEEIVCLEAKRSAIPSNSMEMLELLPSDSPSESAISPT